MAVLPDVDEAAGCQVYLISQQIQQLHSIIQTQRTIKEKHHYPLCEQQMSYSLLFIGILVTSCQPLAWWHLFNTLRVKQIFPENNYWWASCLSRLFVINRGAESWIWSSADLRLVTMYPYSSLAPVPSTSGSPCSFKSCPASAGAACGGWDADAERLALLAGGVAGTEAEEGAGGAPGGLGTGAGFSGLRDTLSVFNSCIYMVIENDRKPVSDRRCMIAACEHWGQWMLTYLLEGDEVFLSWICGKRDKLMFLNKYHRSTQFNFSIYSSVSYYDTLFIWYF